MNKSQENVLPYDVSPQRNRRLTTAQITPIILIPNRNDIKWRCTLSSINVADSQINNLKKDDASAYVLAGRRYRVITRGQEINQESDKRQ